MMWTQRRAYDDKRAAVYSVLTAAISSESQLFQLKLWYINSTCLVLYNCEVNRGLQCTPV